MSFPFLKNLMPSRTLLAEVGPLLTRDPHPETKPLSLPRAEPVPQEGWDLNAARLAVATLANPLIFYGTVGLGDLKRSLYTELRSSGFSWARYVPRGINWFTALTLLLPLFETLKQHLPRYQQGKETAIELAGILAFSLRNAFLSQLTGVCGGFFLIGLMPFLWPKPIMNQRVSTLKADVAQTLFRLTFTAGAMYLFSKESTAPEISS